MISRKQLADMIDQTNLRPDATCEEIEAFCKEAEFYGFGAVCVQPIMIETAKKALAGSHVKVATVCGFPHGSMIHSAKALEAKISAEKGADEVDMVVDIGSVKAGNLMYVEEDIQGVVNACKSVNSDCLVKVIFEVCLLTDEEIKECCTAAEKAGADFVKTSTGFSKAGASVEAVELMRKCVSEKLGVKAAGGIRSLDDALKMIEAGASRLGTSGGIKILREYDERCGE